MSKRAHGALALCACGRTMLTSAVGEWAPLRSAEAARHEFGRHGLRSYLSGSHAGSQRNKRRGQVRAHLGYCGLRREPGAQARRPRAQNQISHGWYEDSENIDFSDVYAEEMHTEG